jgi:hypothetical protein
MLEINIYGPRHRSAGYWAWFADVDASVRRECVLFRGTRAEILATATALTPGPRVRAGDSHTIRRADPLEEFLLQTAASLRHVVNQTCDGYVCELCGEELRHVDAVMDDALEDVDGDIVGYSIPWYDQDDAHEAPSENAVMCLECWRANMSE